MPTESKDTGRRDFIRGVGALSMVPVAGCLGTSAVKSDGKTPDNSTTLDFSSEHLDWLFKPNSVNLRSQDGWYGYSFLRSSEMPPGHPWRKPYEMFGIKSNLQHYAMGSELDTGRLGYANLDITYYDTVEDLMNPDYDESIKNGKISSSIRGTRPASTGGRLSDQDVVEKRSGFDIYERGAAVNKSEGILLSSLQEYVLDDTVKAAIDTYTGKLNPYRTENMSTVYNQVGVRDYNEVALRFHNLSSDYPKGIRAFASSQEVDTDGSVDLRMVEMYSNEEQATDRKNEVGDEHKLYAQGFRITGMERKGKLIKYEGNPPTVLSSSSKSM